MSHTYNGAGPASILDARPYGTMSFADALARIPIGRVVAATVDAGATEWCCHPRHAKPCALPCSVCDDECGPAYRHEAADATDAEAWMAFHRVPEPTTKE